MSQIKTYEILTPSVDIAIIRVGRKALTRTVFNQIPVQHVNAFTYKDRIESVTGHRIRDVLIDEEKLWRDCLGFVVTFDKSTYSEYYCAIWVFNGKLRKFGISLDGSKTFAMTVSHSAYSGMVECAPKELTQLFTGA